MAALDDFENAVTGGTPLSLQLAEETDADGCSANAPGAVDLAKTWVP